MMNNDFESKASARMDGFRVAPSPEVWQRVEAELRQRRRRRFLYWLFPGLLLSGGLLWLPLREHQAGYSADTTAEVQQDMSETQTNKPTFLLDGDHRRTTRGKAHAAKFIVRSSSPSGDPRSTIRNDSAGTQGQRLPGTGKPEQSCRPLLPDPPKHGSTALITPTDTRPDSLSQAGRTISAIAVYPKSLKPQATPADKPSDRVVPNADKGQSPLAASNSGEQDPERPWRYSMAAGAGLSRIGGSAVGISGQGLSYGLEINGRRRLPKRRHDLSIGLAVQGFTTPLRGGTSADRLMSAGNLNSTTLDPQALNKGTQVLHRIDLPWRFHWNPAPKSTRDLGLSAGITPGYTVNRSTSTTPLRRLQWAVSLEMHTPVNPKRVQGLRHFLRLQAGLTNRWSGPGASGTRASFLQYGVRKELR